MRPERSSKVVDSDLHDSVPGLSESQSKPNQIQARHMCCEMQPVCREVSGKLFLF
jgi:hypothetical protein